MRLVATFGFGFAVRFAFAVRLVATFGFAFAVRFGFAAPARLAVTLRFAVALRFVARRFAGAAFLGFALRLRAGAAASTIALSGSA